MLIEVTFWQWFRLFSSIILLGYTCNNIYQYLKEDGMPLIISNLKSIDGDIEDIEKLIKSTTNPLLEQVEDNTAVIETEIAALRFEFNDYHAKDNVQSYLDKILTEQLYINKGVQDIVHLLKGTSFITKDNFLDTINDKVHRLHATATLGGLFEGDMCEYNPLGFGPVVCEGFETEFFDITNVRFRGRIGNEDGSN